MVLFSLDKLFSNVNGTVNGMGLRLHVTVSTYCEVKLDFLRYVIEV